MNQRVFFLALTVVVLVIALLWCPDFAGAAVLIGLLLALYGAGEAGGSLSRSGRSERTSAGREGFNLPGTGAPYATSVPRPTKATGLGLGPSPQRPHVPEGPMEAINLPGRYPGAIDFDEYDSDAAYGHRDLAENDNAYAPLGNPYNVNRVAFTKASGPCLDDEANDDEIDGDERATYQARSRNDATRVTAGTMNRRKVLEGYLNEEVLEAEEREWWGRHEI